MKHSQCTWMFAVIGALTAVVLSHQACSSKVSHDERSPATSTSDVLEPGGTSTDNPKPTLNVVLAPYTETGAHEVQFCIKDIRFIEISGPARGRSAHKQKKSTKATGIVGGIATIISPAGTQIGNVARFRGHITHVEFALSTGCPGGSLMMSTPQGTISTDEPLLVRFEGQVHVDETMQTLTLNIQAVMDQLAACTSVHEVRDRLQRTHGSIHH